MAGTMTRQEPSPAYSNQQCGDVCATKLVCYCHFFNLKKIRKIWGYNNKSQHDKPQTTSSRAELQNVLGIGLHSFL